MCTVSMVGDDFNKRVVPTYPSYPLFENVSREEFNKLKADVEALKELLKAAKKFDEATGQPDCEMDEKISLIKNLAKLVGVDMEDVWKTPKLKKAKHD